MGPLRESFRKCVVSPEDSTFRRADPKPTRPEPRRVPLAPGHSGSATCLDFSASASFCCMRSAGEGDSGLQGARATGGLDPLPGWSPMASHGWVSCDRKHPWFVKFWFSGTPIAKLWFALPKTLCLEHSHSSWRKIENKGRSRKPLAKV